MKYLWLLFLCACTTVSIEYDDQEYRWVQTSIAIPSDRTYYKIIHNDNMSKYCGYIVPECAVKKPGKDDVLICIVYLDAKTGNSEYYKEHGRNHCRGKSHSGRFKL